MKNFKNVIEDVFSHLIEKRGYKMLLIEDFYYIASKKSFYYFKIMKDKHERKLHVASRDFGLRTNDFDIEKALKNMPVNYETYEYENPDDIKELLGKYLKEKTRIYEDIIYNIKLIDRCKEYLPLLLSNENFFVKQEKQHHKTYENVVAHKGGNGLSVVRDYYDRLFYVNVISASNSDTILENTGVNIKFFAEELGLDFNIPTIQDISTPFQKEVLQQVSHLMSRRLNEILFMPEIYSAATNRAAAAIDEYLKDSEKGLRNNIPGPIKEIMQKRNHMN